ncbi:MAG: hypothetical protein Ct9H300mP28_13480 [Pseudomonadota bacterium]|nr:MAG: hypothetical protein Ct9H300mP28_13480 [Pseudomonadota bacterium]
MMDGRVGKFKKSFGRTGFFLMSEFLLTRQNTLQGFYGPFRGALQSAPSGHKKTYQMDPANARKQ